MTEDLDATYETIAMLQYQEKTWELMELLRFLAIAIADVMEGENTWAGPDHRKRKWMNN